MKKFKEFNFKKFRSENYLYINLTSKLSINLLIIPLFLAAFRFGYIYVLLPAFVTAFFHELFHIAAIKITGNTFRRIYIEPFGISAQINESSFFNSASEMFISIAGPLFNFITALLILLMKRHINIHNYNFFLTLNLTMGLFNLIPALPLDGGRFLRAILNLKFGIIRSYNFMICLSKFITAFLLLISIVIIIFSPFNFSLILIVSFMMANLCCERAALSKIILSDILSAKSIPENIHKKRNKLITVSENTPARIILKLISFDYFIDIIILNSKGRVVSISTETEVINLLIENGIRSKFSDIKQR